jgi:hypothetical protein
MSKKETELFVVAIGDKEVLVDTGTALRAQKLALGVECYARKATAKDVARIGVDAIITEKERQA